MTHLRQTILPLFVAIVLACFALSPGVQAVVPPPDGGYPGFNTAEGQNALFSLTTGVANTAVGWFSLLSDTDGSFNTATGAGSLLFNVSGANNTAVGAAALLFNTGSGNTAVGAAALVNNTTADFNTAVGEFALNNIATGEVNTAIGFQALKENIAGSSNTAIGASALDGATGSGCIAVGYQAGDFVGSSNNVIAIGSPGDDVDNSTWIGNIYGVTTQSGTTASVIVSDSGQLGTVASGERFKKDISSMDEASEAILSLRPVTFHYKSDARETPQFGLIAEEVAKVDPTLVLPDKEGKPYSVRYDAVNAMLLNEFLKEHRKVERLEATVLEQQNQIKALTAGLENVNAQLKVNGAARVVENTY